MARKSKLLCLITTVTIVVATWTGQLAESADDAMRELHIVCIYEGNTKTGNTIHGERAQVRVDRPGKSVVLFLGSHGSVTWDVQIAPETKVESVILGGREKQAVKGLPGGVQIVAAFGEDRNQSLIGGYRLDSWETRRLIQKLAKTTKLAADSFYGIYRPESVIAVDQKQIDPRLSPDFPVVAADVKFPDESFIATHYVSGRSPHEVSVSVGDFTFGGGPKLETLKQIPGRHSNLAYDSEAKQWYGWDHQVVALDLTRRQATALPAVIDLPKISRPSAMAFDSRRRRLLVATADSDGLLYQFSVEKKNWSIVSSLNGADLHNLCYSPHDDSLYSIVLGYDGNSHTIPTLWRMNALGAVIDQRELEGPFFAGMIGDSHHGGSVQLIPVGHQLAMVARSNSYDSGDGSSLEAVTYIFLVDPSDSTAKLAWKSGNKPTAVSYRHAVIPPKPALTASQREVHAICLYEGNNGPVRVTVDRPDTQVTLFLSSYESCKWNITLTPGTRIERILLGGYEPQSVEGLPKEIPIQNASDEGERRGFYAGYNIQSPQFRYVLQQLKRKTNLELASCQTAYRAKSPYTIKEISDDPLLSSTYPQPVSTDKLPKLKFEAIFAASAGRHGHKSVSWGAFTEAGPNFSTMRNLPKNISRVAYDPQKKQYYGLGGNQVYLLNLTDQSMTELELGMDVPRVSWPSALEFDAKQRRLILVASGLIYQCDVDRNHQWSVLCELPRGNHVHSVAYDPGSSQFYLLAGSHGEEGGAELWQLNDAGARVGTIPLGPPILSGMLGGSPGSNSHLVPVGGKLVILAYPSQSGSESPPTASYMFVVDPKNGETQLAWKK